MNKDKLNALHFNAGIHTVSIRSEHESCLHKEDVSWISREDIRPTTLKDGSHKKWYLYKLNLNKIVPGEVWSLNQFEQLIEKAAKAMGLDRWQYVRIDTRFDRYENDYEEYLKLMKLIVLLVAQEYGLTNRYECFDPLTLVAKTVKAAYKHSPLELEYYNKDLESPGYKAKSRLELRTSKIYGYAAKDTEAIIAEWGTRLKKSINGYEQLQTTCNECLLKRWETDRAARRVNNTSEFVRLYQENIYSKRQLVALLDALGSKNPETQAKNLKHRYQLEFFTWKELEIVLQKIFDSMNAYFEAAPAEQESIKNENFVKSEEVEKVA